MSRLQIRVRRATPDDAGNIIELVKGICADGDVDLPMEPDEFPHTLEEEQKFLDEVGKSDNSVFLVAETAEGRIVGICNAGGGKRRALRHAVTIGISVHRQFRNRGVGTALLLELINWARSTGVVKRIELSVYARNERAIHVYEKLGFVQEGRRRKAARDRQTGEFIDDLIMALLLE
jgi:RimJ/RimL family protein N-acetyltransferase